MKGAAGSTIAEPEGGAFVRAPRMGEIAAARVRLRGALRRTPVLELPVPGGFEGARVLAKCEQFQVTGAFKARGALNAVASLSPEELGRGVATHSSGNHGAALAWAAGRCGAAARIVVPAGAVASKREAIRRFGGSIVDCGPTQAEREAGLATVLAETGAVAIHPYDDARVIAGQATATVEFLETAPRLDRLIVPVGGGGLAAGAVLARRLLGAKTEIVGVEPAGADDTRRSLDAGRRVACPRVDTLADGLRAQVGRATFPILQQGLSDLVTVDEEAILAATYWALAEARLVVEPSSATVLAALASGLVPASGVTGVLLSGGNLDFTGEAWRRALAHSGRTDGPARTLAPGEAQ